MDMDMDADTAVDTGAGTDAESTPAPAGSEYGVATKTPGVRVPMIAEDAVRGRAAAMFEATKAATGLPFVPDMFRLTSTNPDLMHVVITGFAGMFAEGALPRETKELIAAWTSKINSCNYCVGTHNWFLLQFGGTQELADAIASSNDVDDLPLDEKTKTMMRLISKVSTAAYKVVDADWEAAWDAGWTDAELLEAVFCASLFNFINRLVDSTGLGVVQQQSKISQQQAEEA
jgi:uncharacterized peroxidase-related enzyme